MASDQYKEEDNGARPGCVIAGWVLFFVTASIIGLFGYKVWVFYGILSKGERIRLPQFAAAFTVENGADAGGSLGLIERSVVESGGQGSSEGADAALTVVEFGDFQCPFSKTAHPVVRRMMAKYGDRVRFIYRNFPIESIHPDAMLASIASECAGAQGRFWAYHDKLYLNAPALAFRDLIRYGEEIGLDTAAFEQCVIARETEGIVQEDIAAAKEGGVRGTPTFFFNGYMIEGAIPEEDLDRVIEDLLTRLP